jgi:hypothetical protein
VQKLDALSTFLACFALASFAGLAQLLRSGRPLGWRSVSSAILYSGIMGLLIGLFWWSQCGGDANPYFTIAVSGLAGIGGTSVLDFFLQILSKGGLHITFTPAERTDTPKSKS